jgi:DNA-binding XRE family transcriptional regulator
MKKDDLIKIITEKLRLIRTEHNFSQEKMADILGLSKKTLVQIEKGRTDANWTTVIAVCSLFSTSEILKTSLGDDSLEVVKTLTFGETSHPKDKTFGGRIWWKTISEKKCFKLQQNHISQHFRILDNEDYRWYSTFDKKDALKRLNELADEIKN